MDEVLEDNYTYLVHKYPSSLPPNLIPQIFHGIKIDGATDLTNILFCMSYLWVEDIIGYWGYSISITQDILTSYIWDESRWIVAEIPIEQLVAYY